VSQRNGLALGAQIWRFYCWILAWDEVCDMDAGKRVIWY
jgi:hypothetical protein